MAPRKGIGGHQSAAASSVVWLTPPDIIAALGGADSFDLDPCTPFCSPIRTARRAMSYVTQDDDRVHLTPDDAISLGQKIVAFARKEAVGGLDGPACNECLAKALICAYAALADDVAKTKNTGEMTGVALAAMRARAVFDDITKTMIARAVSIDPVGMLEIARGELKSTHP